MPGTFKPMHSIAHLVSDWTHHLPAALVVSALVYIFHHHLHLLDAIDGYAFLGIGNRTAFASRTIGNDPTVAVVLIDQRSHENYYRGRNPLDRCELKKDLEGIYELAPPPKVVVIDLDLSPALPVMPFTSAENIRASRCTEQIKILITQHPGTHTVLMQPSKARDPDNQAKILKWNAGLAPRADAVSFADPNITVSYGMVNGLDCDADSLAATALEHYPSKSPERRNCLTEHDKELKISPREYLSGLRATPVSWMPARGADQQCAISTPYARFFGLPVVFFGGSYDDGDTYLTPIGTMYGVEVHAAAFMSLLRPTKVNELLAFAFDVGLGLLLGTVIDYCWRRYFSLRFGSSAFERQKAPWFIVLLMCVYAVGVGLLTVGSFFCLLYLGIWLSPIPIALGMLIESFFNSAVTAAVSEGYEQRQALLIRLRAIGPDGIASRLAREADQRPQHAHGLKERVARYFYLDWKRLRNTGQKDAANLLLIRRLTFFVLLVVALFWEMLSQLIKWLALLWDKLLHLIEALL